MIKKLINHIQQGTLIPVLINIFHPIRLFIRVFKIPHIYNRLEYKRRFGIFKSIKKPHTFSQKIYYLRDIYDGDELATQVSDKYKVRKYIETHGLGHILNDLIGVYNSPSEINFAKLPNQFVIKTNHASGTNIIVKNKNDIDEQDIKKQLGKWLKKNYAYSLGEMQYKNIVPKIIIEKYLQEPNSDSDYLIDYKFWCFGSEVRYLQIIKRYNNGFIRYCLKVDFTKCDFYTEDGNDYEDLVRPKSLHDMILYSSQLSKRFPFVRVDFYEINGKPVFGEMTLTPTAGNNYFLSDVAQIELGKLIQLNYKYI